MTKSDAKEDIASHDPFPTVDAAKIRTCLGDLLSRVAFGSEIIVIRRNGKKVAALVPLDVIYERQP